mmetsp:Transcript_122603/g.342051  ORF Transcript_122603/g.342051 Transcript_122603/m.342051 type:complete len:118 (+) Transcript_122603:68-421(+)
MKQKEASSISSSSSSSKPKAETVGEELYLVHLRRHEGEEPRPEDFDFESPHHLLNKKRGYSSAGEELWNVHMKRSRGMEPDIDCDGEEKPGGEPHPKEDIKHCRYNLRTRRREPKSP